MHTHALRVGSNRRAAERSEFLPDSMADQPSEETEARTGGPGWLRPLIGVCALVVIALLARAVGGYVPVAAEWVEGLGAWGPLAFVGVYVIATVLVVPGALLTLAGGAIFGLVDGTLYVFVAASLGATLAFLVGRYGARGWVEGKLAQNPRFAAVDRAVAQNGLKITFLLRLSPVFPFSFLNYALGLSQVRLRDYVIACIGMLPATVLYVYYGQVIGDVAALAGGAASDKDTGYWMVTGLGLVATIAVTSVVTRIARRALADASEIESVAAAPPAATGDHHAARR
jgi:uncharacterized membrane protein YdjX (TVP38/TMEM64 family)